MPWFRNPRGLPVLLAILACAAPAEGRSLLRAGLLRQSRLSKADLGLPEDLGLEGPRQGDPFLLRSLVDVAYLVNPRLDDAEALSAMLAGAHIGRLSGEGTGLDAGRLGELIDQPRNATLYYETVDRVAREFLDAVMGLNRARSAANLYSLVNEIRTPRFLLITFDAAPRPLGEEGTRLHVDFSVRMHRVLRSKEAGGGFTVTSCELCFEDQATGVATSAPDAPLTRQLHEALVDALRRSLASSFCGAVKMRRDDPALERDGLIGPSLSGAMISAAGEPGNGAGAEREVSR
jgi:hypothetical protein